MAEAVRQEKLLLDGRYNPQPNWRNPETFEKVLYHIGFTDSYSLDPDSSDGIWTIYSNQLMGEGEKLLIVAAYEVSVGSLGHIFTNNPPRTTDSLELVLRNAQDLAIRMSDTELYPRERTRSWKSLKRFIFRYDCRRFFKRFIMIRSSIHIITVLWHRLT